MTAINQVPAKAILLLDERDLNFFDKWDASNSEKRIYFPVSFVAMQQLLFRNNSREYCLPDTGPRFAEQTDSKAIFELCQAFLADLFQSNPRFDNPANFKKGFPLEYFWYCLFTAIHRLILFCKNLHRKVPVSEVVLVHRQKTIEFAGLQISAHALTRIVENYFRHRGVTVQSISRNNGNGPSETLYHYGQNTWRSTLKRALKFFFWKSLSYRKPDYSYLLIDPSYDNTIDFLPPFAYPDSKMPQVFFDDSIPYFHSFRQILKYYRDLFREKPATTTKFEVPEFSFTIDDYCINFGRLFEQNIRVYLQRLAETRHSVDLWWQHLPGKERIKAIIFSLPPVFMTSHYLIRKVKEQGAKVITRQHGGFYGYADHPNYNITDYRPSDIFLSYGLSHHGNHDQPFAKNACLQVEMGTHYIYPSRKFKNRVHAKNSKPSKGLFLPAVIATYYSQARIDWDAVRQFMNLKEMVDIFSSGTFGNIEIKGLYRHRPHSLLKTYIDSKNCPYISFGDGGYDSVITPPPAFVIFDAPSTPLIETLTRFSGPVFLMNCQNSWKIHSDALRLLKKRVFYSETISQLHEQLSSMQSKTKSCNHGNNEFISTYVKPFSLKQYRQFIARITD